MGLWCRIAKANITLLGTLKQVSLSTRSTVRSMAPGIGFEPHVTLHTGAVLPYQTNLTECGTRCAAQVPARVLFRQVQKVQSRVMVATGAVLQRLARNTSNYEHSTVRLQSLSF